MAERMKLGDFSSLDSWRLEFRSSNPASVNAGVAEKKPGIFPFSQLRTYVHRSDRTTPSNMSCQASTGNQLCISPFNL